MRNSDFMNLQTIKDILLILGSTTTIIFAFVGFNKWKRELKGRTKYESSRKLLKALYSFRDAFKSLRSVLILASELPENYDRRKTDEAKEMQHVFTNRLKYFNEPYNSLRSLLPEVEIEYEAKLLDLFYDLFYQITLYHMKMNEYFQLIGNTNKDAHFQEVRKVILAIGEDNPTTKKFTSIVEQIESELKNEMKKY